MTTRREKSKTQKPQINKQLEAAQTEQKPQVNHRQEKFADYLIDVSKYVLTGVVITSLFNDVTDKTTIYLVGLGVVGTTLLLGLRLTNKRKDKEYGNVFSWTVCRSSVPDFPHLYLYS